MPPLRQPLILSLALALGACVAFFPPDEDDDGVQRCDTSNDCSGPEYDDARITGQCVPAAEDNAPKVCVAGWTPTNCNGAQGGAIGDTFTAAQDSSAYTQLCSEENRGKPGCAPLSGACDDGQAPIEVEGFQGTLCPHPEAEFGWLALPPNDARKGTDVLDQACRHFFCDRSFVCNTNTSACVPCDPNRDPGQGGCAEMYIQGAPSQIYMSDDELPGADACARGVFGSAEAFAKGVPGSDGM